MKKNFLLLIMGLTIGCLAGVNLQNNTGKQAQPQNMVKCLAQKSVVKTPYELALAEIKDSEQSMLMARASDYSNMASAHLLQTMCDEQKKQTEILQEILKNCQK